MGSVLVSVVIPAYKQAQYVGDAIRSVQKQTWPNFEAIVVNDASPDDTSEIIRSFADPRVKLIIHGENRGLSAARNTGICASSGEILALLDADDMFHPDKLRMHVDFFENHKDIGVTYNARFELNHSDTTIRGIWRPPVSVNLLDLVKGFPFSPSDMVLRREWLTKVGLFDPRVGSGEDTDLPCRLALAGCRFAGIDRALNYRRYHSGRKRRNLRGRLNDISSVLKSIFADPRCPEDVRAIGGTAMKSHMMALMSLALIQEETQLAHELIHELIRMDPFLLEGNPCGLLDYLTIQSIADETLNHEILLSSMFSQLPERAAVLTQHYDWAVACGYLRRAIRAVIWDRLEDGKAHFEKALELKAKMNHEMLQSVTHQILSYESEFGAAAARERIGRLSPCLDQFRPGRWGSKLMGSYFLNHAFENYRAAAYSSVPGEVLRALGSDPSYIADRGAMAILAYSLIHVLRD